MGPVNNVAQCGVLCSNWHWLQCNAYEVHAPSKSCYLYLLFNGRRELVDNPFGTFVYLKIYKGISPSFLCCFLCLLCFTCYRVLAVS